MKRSELEEGHKNIARILLLSDEFAEVFRVIHEEVGRDRSNQSLRDEAEAVLREAAA